MDALRQKAVRQRTFMVLALTALSMSTAYAAGHHQICYQGTPFNNRPRIVVHCRSDLAVGCSVDVSGVTGASTYLAGTTNGDHVTAFTVP